MPSRSLTDHEVLEIRASAAPVRQLSERFGVCLEVIRRVRRGEQRYALALRADPPLDLIPPELQARLDAAQHNLLALLSKEKQLS